MSTEVQRAMPEFPSLLAMLDRSPLTGAEEGVLYLLSLVVVVSLALGGLLVHGLMLHRVIKAPQLWFRGVSTLNWRPWSLRDCGLLVVALVVFMFLVSAFNLLVSALTGSAPLDQALGASVLIMLGTYGGAAVFILLLQRKNGVSWQAAFDTSSLGFLQKVTLGGAFYVASMPVIMLSSAISIKLLTLFQIPIQQQEVFDLFQTSNSPIYIFLLAFSAVIMAPVVEELAFRGLFLPVLAKRIGPVKSLLVVSVVFSLIHLHPAGFLPLFVLALYMGLAYLLTQSIVTPIVIHMLFNGINLGLFLGVSG